VAPREESVVVLLGDRSGIGRIEHVTGDEQHVDPLARERLDEPIEEPMVLVLAGQAVKRMTQMPV
jgi:hypothetical protein